MKWGWSRGGLVVVVLAFGVSTACAGPHQRSEPAGAPAPATAMLKDGASAPGFVPQAPPNAPPVDTKRDVVKTASMTVTVANTSEAADKAAVVAEDAAGRVDSRTEDAGSGSGRARTSVVLRVPAAKLDGVVRDLKAFGTVQNAETQSDDVTAQRVDLDARITALQTSVDRLLGIMRDARDPDALIKAEDALSQRQADLDSLRAQRDKLGDRVAYSTVDVTFVAQQIGGPAPQQYEGFTGQVKRGWDGMVSLASNVVMLFGLLLPWLVVLAIVVGIAYVALRLSRQRARVSVDTTPADETPAEPVPAETTTAPGGNRGPSDESQG